MSEWRPDGNDWEQKRVSYISYNTRLGIGIESEATYEAGADAILAALRADNTIALHCEIAQWIEDCAGIAGTWVFIPDDKILPSRCQLCPPETIGEFKGKSYCGVCGWLVEELPFSEPTNGD